MTKSLQNNTEWKRVKLEENLRQYRKHSYCDKALVTDTSGKFAYFSFCGFETRFCYAPTSRKIY